MTAHPMPSVPAEEAQRIEALFATRALTVPDERLRPIAEFAREAFDMPMAHMSLVDTETQWFRATAGLAAESCKRADSFCSHVIAQGEAMVIPDAWADFRFAENPFVTGAPYVRFYAGVPLQSAAGYSLGTLCILDTKPRRFDAADQRQLARLAGLAAEVIAAGGDAGSAQDHATGLLREAAIRDCAATAISDGAATGQHAAVFCIDIERFRETLLARGAAYAEKLLAEVGRRLFGAFGQDASLGRLGTDQFLAVKRLDGDVVDLAALAEPARAAFEDAFVIDGETAVLAARIGVGVYPADGVDAATVIAHADQALHTRRTMGTTTVSAYDPELARKLNRDLTVERRLRMALAGETAERPSMVYQPKVAVSDGRVVGAEALMRWHDDELGRVSPGEFIPVAESSGLIHSLGRQSLAEACQAAADWPIPAGAPAPAVAVNVAAAQLTSRTFIGAVEEILTVTGLAPQRLILEVTETALIEDTETVRQAMAALAAYGVRFAIDDFGTGYASFSYLHRLPVQQLKIDRTFVRNIVEQPRDVSLCKAMIAMGHELGLKVVAEGVESRAQFDILARLGCDTIQGFLVAPGMGDADCRALLSTRVLD